MKTFLKTLRLLGLVLLILLASFGLGIMLPNRERYQDKEIRIELVEKKKDEVNEESEMKEE